MRVLIRVFINLSIAFIVLFEVVVLITVSDSIEQGQQDAATGGIGIAIMLALVLYVLVRLRKKVSTRPRTSGQGNPAQGINGAEGSAPAPQPDVASSAGHRRDVTEQEVTERIVPALLRARAESLIPRVQEALRFPLPPDAERALRALEETVARYERLLGPGGTEHAARRLAALVAVRSACLWVLEEHWLEEMAAERAAMPPGLAAAVLSEAATLGMDTADTDADTALDVALLEPAQFLTADSFGVWLARLERVPPNATDALFHLAAGRWELATCALSPASLTQRMIGTASSYVGIMAWLAYEASDERTLDMPPEAGRQLAERLVAGRIDEECAALQEAGDVLTRAHASLTDALVVHAAVQWALIEDYRVVRQLYRRASYRNEYGDLEDDAFVADAYKFAATRVGPRLARLCRRLDAACRPEDIGVARYEKRIVEALIAAMRLSATASGELAGSGGPADDDPALAEDGYDFERRIARRLEACGWSTAVTRGSGDFGADILATKAGRTVVIQCKHHAAPVGVKAVQEAVAARTYYQADAAAVVATNGFTPQARQLARRADVALLRPDALGALDRATGAAGPQ